MAKTISVVNTSSDTFQIFIDRVNEVILAVNTEVLTANDSAAGALTSGNSYLAGIFGAATLTANGVLRGGNVSTANTLYVTSNLNINSSTLFVTNNTANVTILPTTVTVANSTRTVVITSSSITVGNSTVNVFTNSSQIIVGSSTINSTTLAVGSNTIITDAGLSIGNSTVNVSTNSTVLSIGSSVVNSTAIVSPLVDTGLPAMNATHIVVGANVILSSVLLSIGNSTVNTTVNSSLIIVNDIDATIANITSATIEVLTTNTLVVNTSLEFGANAVLNTNSLRFGNSTANLVINSTAIQVSNTSGNFPVIFNDTISNTDFTNKFFFSNYTTTGTSEQTIDTFVLTDVRSCEWFLSIKNNSANGFMSLKLSCLQAGATVYNSQYALLYSNTNLGTFDVTSNATHGLLKFTPTPANTTVTFVRTNLAA